MMAAALCSATAYADVIFEPEPIPDPASNPTATALIVAMALIAAAVIVWLILRSRKSK